MAVTVTAITPDSPAERCGIRAGDILLSIDGHEIVDVLDYRFYQTGASVSCVLQDGTGRVVKKCIEKEEYDEIGLEFQTYLMDEKHSCRNKCIFCFIDQLPKGMRDSLYFKDDDSRLSFLFGNYITLTNLSEHEIGRIIKMHISPINISVHTTDPELRVKMMKNPHAGEVLAVMDRLNDAGIEMHCQLVLVPGYNDGQALQKTLADLTAKPCITCIAAVPVGLTDHREGLPELKPFDRDSAEQTLQILDRAGDFCVEKYGERRVYGSDEFYLLAGRKIPDADYYGEFLQLENGVGLWALLKAQAAEALAEMPECEGTRTVSIATGVAAAPLIREIAQNCMNAQPGLTVQVFPIENRYFGKKITVAGLVTGTDLKAQLCGKDLGEELLIPSCMLRAQGDLFLDGISLSGLSEALNIPITPVDNDGADLVDAIFGI